MERQQKSSDKGVDACIACFKIEYGDLEPGQIRDVMFNCWIKAWVKGHLYADCVADKIDWRQWLLGKTVANQDTHQLEML